jgi:hypothetical protein
VAPSVTPGVGRSVAAGVGRSVAAGVGRSVAAGVGRTVGASTGVSLLGTAAGDGARVDNDGVATGPRDAAPDGVAAGERLGSGDAVGAAVAGRFEARSVGTAVAVRRGVGGIRGGARRTGGGAWLSRLAGEAVTTGVAPPPSGQPPRPATDSPAPMTNPKTTTPMMIGTIGSEALLSLGPRRRERRGGVSCITQALREMDARCFPRSDAS